MCTHTHTPATEQGILLRDWHISATPRRVLGQGPELPSPPQTKASLRIMLRPRKKQLAFYYTTPWSPNFGYRVVWKILIIYGTSSRSSTHIGFVITQFPKPLHERSFSFHVQFLFPSDCNYRGLRLCGHDCSGLAATRRCVLHVPWSELSLQALWKTRLRGAA